jgi:predicted Zn-dependent protease
MGTTPYPKNRIPIQHVSSDSRRGKILLSCPYYILGKPKLYKLIATLTLIISTGLLIILFNFYPQVAVANPTALKSHPLPSTLASWQDTKNSGNYFDQVTPVKIGYLIWSKFPVKVYIETPVNSNQAETWVKTVASAIQEWNAYLPLEIINQPGVADITITRKSPPLQGNPPRARSAQTSYNLYTQNNLLYHRFTILLSPSQTGNYLLAAARHELGHALGIWGHSKLQSDALYFSQVRNPPLISARDVNTLKRVYEQPTNLGWSIN